MAADPAPIPVVPLPIPSGSSAGKVPEGAFLLATSPWLLVALVLLGLAGLRQLLRGSIPSGSGLGAGPSWRKNPQLGPIQDPVYLQRILQAELESQQQSADRSAQHQPPQSAAPQGQATGVAAGPSSDEPVIHQSGPDA